MNTKLQAQIETITKSLMKDKVIMNFCKNEALETVAAEIREAAGNVTTAKAAELLGHRYTNIQKRIDQYTAAALHGCVLKKMEMMYSE